MFQARYFLLGAWIHPPSACICLSLPHSACINSRCTRLAQVPTPGADWAAQVQAAHQKQQAPAAEAATTGGQLTRTSYLGNLLPESLLYVLTSQGPGAFAAAMTADSDTPELVWTYRMRTQRLVPQVTLLM